MTAANRRRHRAILELIQEREIASQGELLELLADRGIPITQPQLSRDLRALDVVKRDGAYRATERVTPLESLAPLLRGARPAGPNLVCVFCEPGAASAIARALEAQEIEGLVGTVAGDDTVFCAVEKKSGGDALRRLIEGLLD